MADNNKKDQNEAAEENSEPSPPSPRVPARQATPSSEDSAASTPPVTPQAQPHPQPQRQSESEGPGRQQRHRKAFKLPSVDELIAQLLQLNGAVLLGQISTQQANLMYRTITAAINALLKRSSGTQDHVKDTESLVDAIRRDPTLLNTFAAFLSDDQLDRLMNELNGHDEGEHPTAA